ncbi:helix-turn-helix transcriptional regulator [Tateyamaria pelophila]|uniref:helix-turn-helix transcriptional regulator n=1 Tax=Tateyamaria pelophila TaxID=328415 RepID=UPI001CBE940A|nr:helix-turn-helix transcriptional regulator [Tateyamaria pelophila]
MDKISTCRAAYLIPFLDVLRDIGTPVERELERAKLPAMVEETPEEPISKAFAVEFLAANEKREGIDDLGWLGVHHHSMSIFSTDLLTALMPMPTVKARLDRFAGLSELEDSDVNIGIAESDAIAEVFCDVVQPKELKGYDIAEWVQVYVLIDIVRSIMGKGWSPDEIRFKSDFSVCDAAREANPNTRFLSQSVHTSIIMPSSVLAASQLTCGAAQVPELSIPDKRHGTENLKRLMRPYLREGTPKIEVLAEIMGVSPRSLQRKLKQSGSSYSELIETTRFEMAAEILAASDTPLIDVAMTLGYENQSNFGRSFRRISGISPGKYRREVIGRERAA